MNEIAVHEAGHLVIAHALGLKLFGAMATYTAGGGALHQSCTEDQKIAICLAGGIATTMAGLADLEGCSRDFATVRKNLEGTANAEKVLNVCIEEVIKILQARWPAVQVVATALAHKVTITGQEAEDLIRAAMAEA